MVGKALQFLLRLFIRGHVFGLPAVVLLVFRLQAAAVAVDAHELLQDAGDAADGRAARSVQGVSRAERHVVRPGMLQFEDANLFVTGEAVAAKAVRFRHKFLNQFDIARRAADFD